MIHNLRDAFGELVNENTWMDDTTRALAKEKVLQKSARKGDFYLLFTCIIKKMPFYV